MTNDEFITDQYRKLRRKLWRELGLRFYALVHWNTERARYDTSIVVGYTLADVREQKKSDGTASVRPVVTRQEQKLAIEAYMNLGM